MGVAGAVGGVAGSRTVSVTGFTLRRVDREGDLALIHRWMNDPEVAAYWHTAEPMSEISAYLAMRGASPSIRLCVGELSGEPMSYWELYRADRDALGCFYDALPHDIGVSVLIGPPEWRGKGVASRLIDTVARQIFADTPETPRIVADPAVRNVAAVRAFTSAGFRTDRELVLPDKRAVLVIRERAIGLGAMAIHRGDVSRAQHVVAVGGYAPWAHRPSQTCCALR